MEHLKLALQPTIPTPAKLFGWFLVLAGCFFGVIYATNPGAVFPGVSIASYSEQFGLYSTAVRILGAVAGILIALILNSAALLALMLATRVFIELGDVTVGLIINHGVPDANTYGLLVLAAVEAYFLITLLKVVRHSPRQS
jgi:hypothetical protein